MIIIDSRTVEYTNGFEVKADRLFNEELDRGKGIYAALGVMMERMENDGQLDNLSNDFLYWLAAGPNSAKA